jgi:hypothetical protein
VRSNASPQQMQEAAKWLNELQGSTRWALVQDHSRSQAQSGLSRSGWTVAHELLKSTSFEVAFQGAVMLQNKVLSPPTHRRPQVEPRALIIVFVQIKAQWLTIGASDRNALRAALFGACACRVFLLACTLPVNLRQAHRWPMRCRASEELRQVDREQDAARLVADSARYVPACVCLQRSAA